MEEWNDDLRQQEELLNYINGELGDKEMLDFETRLKNDESLALLYREYQNIMTGIEHWGDQQILSSIKNVEQDLAAENFFENINKGRIPSFVSLLKKHSGWSLAVAASICLLIYVGYQLWLPAKQSQDTYNSYFQLDTYSIDTYLSDQRKSGLIPTSNASDTIALALEKYKYGNYIAAIELFEQLGSIDKDQALVKYYLGLSYMAISNFEKAIPILKNLCGTVEKDYGEKACWNYALAQLRLHGYTSDTKGLFQQLANNTSGAYAKSAGDILAQWR